MCLYIYRLYASLIDIMYTLDTRYAYVVCVLYKHVYKPCIIIHGLYNNNNGDDNNNNNNSVW